MDNARIQSLASPWWESCPTHPIQQWQLVRVFVPHVDLTPLTLVVDGRIDPRDHGTASFRIEPLRIHQRRAQPTLPVAALPAFTGEVYTVHRSKVRYALVVMTGGADIQKDLRPSASPKWQTAPTFLVAPYYGIEQTEGRAGWHAPLVNRIRSCEYPQFVLDQIPGARTQSILRLDHIQPVGKHQDSWEPLPHRLGTQAREILDEWVTWLRTGILDDGTMLALCRAELMLPSMPSAGSPAP